jgi:hypothetical protein
MQLKSKTSQQSTVELRPILQKQNFRLFFVGYRFFSVFSTPTSVSVSVFLKTDFSVSVSVTDPALVYATTQKIFLMQKCRLVSRRLSNIGTFYCILV